MRLAPLAAAAAAVLIAAPVAAPAAPPAKTRADWTKTVALTPEGGFRIGNPAAKVKLVEYGSLTCPHCRDFAAQAMGPLLSTYVKSGKVSFEYRNFVLNGVDVTATLVARCGGSSNFFPVVEQLYASQEDWVGRIAGLPQAEKDKLRALSPGERLTRIAEAGGLIAVVSRHGVPAERAKACLADEAGLNRLGEMADAANAQGVHGTPTFFINGVRAEANTWAGIEPLIKQAVG